jgi:Cft2 family RNA processing exonuclease
LKITNLNPDTDIGASSWLVDLGEHRLLLDAGMHPKREGRDGLPLFKATKGQDLDAIALSHCHHDHVGGLPIACEQFPKAHVLMTELSFLIAERVLHNSVNVMTRQREELGIREYPLYTHDDLEEITPHFQAFKYNREIEWGSFQKTRAGITSPTLEFFDAGHTLGSAGVLVRNQKESLFFTGDVCFHDQTLLRAARFDKIKADVLIMETTRGDRQVPAGFTRQGEIDRLVESIHRVLKRKGTVLIPAFALGRTQEILALLALLMQEGKLKPQPIYIGGLGRVFTELYDVEAHRCNRNHPNLQLREALNIIVLEKGQAQKMKLSGQGRIFVITAGMMSENTAAHDLAARMMDDERHGIFFVGYADPDTPGGRLKSAKHGETFVFSPGVGRLTRKCEVLDFDLTAHANRDDLLNFVGQVSPRAVLLGHGGDAARHWFEEQIRARHPQMKIIQPQPGHAVEV